MPLEPPPLELQIRAVLFLVLFCPVVVYLWVMFLNFSVFLISRFFRSHSDRK